MRTENQKYHLTRLFVAIALVTVLSPAMAQRILNTPLTASLTVQDGTGIILAPGFSTNGFNFQALIGVPYVDVTPSSDKNYIISTTYNAATTSGVVTKAADLHREIQYFDGLGRPMQSVSVQSSPNGKDIITPIRYDNFGRESTKYLPYAGANNNGLFVSTDLTEQSTFYSGLINGNDGPKAFAITDYEPSPLNRVLRQGAPGAAWQPDAAIDHTVKLAYGTNTAADNVRMWTVNSDGSPASAIAYPVNSLYKTTTWDENNPNDLATTTSRTEEFKDKQGKVVLKRSYNGNVNPAETLSTYYVYDDFELLRVVVPPLANGDGGNVTALLNDLCYQYTYDARKRMTMKKLPGADPVYLVYDQRDRLVATQDGVQRAKSPDEWIFTKYDALNRPIMTGVYKVTDGTTQATVQAIVNGSGIYSENRSSTTTCGYSSNSFPAGITDADILTLTYYDTYGFPGSRTFDYSANKISDYDEGASIAEADRYYFKKVKGQVTGSRTKVLETTTFLTSTNYYDDHYRVIQNLRDLYSDTPADNEVASVLYDFSGKVIKTLTKQVFFSKANTIIEKNRYDHVGRLIQVTHQVNSGTEVALASMQYDEIGQLKQKSLNGEVSSGIQNLNYSYNIRGWLEKINNPDVTPSASSTQKLNLGLYYNNVPSGLSANQQFNGNISGLVWNTPEQINALSPADKQGYGFTYDGLNRMRTSNYGEGATFATNANANNENVAYDKNGNITFLTRYKKGTGLIDNLSYTYKNGNASNMLDKVDDTVAGDYGFSEYVKQTNEYAYDGNGNLINDDNKGYNSILYNYMNLPKRVGTTGSYISYVYDASGTKLAKINTGGACTYYAGSFVYSGSSLNYIIHREGMYLLPGGNYQYYLKDHLGNTRLVVNTSGVGGEIVQQTDYYPFGMDIANYNSGNANKYRYNGKEFHDDMINGKRLEWYDYGARFYDPQIGRWHSPDAFSEYFFEKSAYNYVSGNPVNSIDPDGNFETRFGAWLYKIFNGGGNILQDSGGEYFVSNQVKYTGEEAGVAIRRDFGWYNGSDPSGQGGKTLDNLNTINNIADVGMDIAEESGYVATIGRTGYYSSGWNGNQYVKTLGVAKGLGYVFFGAGIVLDGTMYYTGQQSGAKTSVNIGVSAASLIIGGIPGIILGGGYFTVDKTVGWDRMMTPASNDQWVPNRAVFPDGTTIYVCFKAGTEILAKGGFKPIEQIVVGDSVYSYNLEKNAIELSKVVKSFERKTQEIYELTTDNQKIYVTAEHPFYVVGSGWVKVKDLQAGAVLKTKDGSIEHVINSFLEKHPETVYNIEVEGNHNYFVTNSNILVHNK